MARYSPEHKEETRRRMIETAGRRFKSDGIDGSGIATLVADAGLTNGAFYGHFASKDDLVARSSHEQLADQVASVNSLPAGLASVEAFVREYLSPAHRDDLAGRLPLRSTAGRDRAHVTWPSGRPTPTGRRLDDRAIDATSTTAIHGGPTSVRSGFSRCSSARSSPPARSPTRSCPTACSPRRTPMAMTLRRPLRTDPARPTRRRQNEGLRRHPLRSRRAGAGRCPDSDGRAPRTSWSTSGRPASTRSTRWSATASSSRLIKYKRPFVLGHDLAGVITKVGADVRGFTVGDEVYARPRDLRIGDLRRAQSPSTLTTLPSSQPRCRSRKPAAVPLVALAAWQALVDVADVQPGQKVLVHAGAGGLGSTVIQVAKHLGAHVATTAHTNDLDKVRALGADEVIDFTQQDFTDLLVRVRRRAGLPRRGQPGEVADRPQAGRSGHQRGRPTRPALRRPSSGSPLLKPVMAVLSRKIRRQARKLGVRYSFFFMRASGAQLTALAALYDAGTLRPVLDRSFPFDQDARRHGLRRTGQGRRQDRGDPMTSVLVTGAGRGIGLAITRHLSERGWDVYATARSTDDLRDLANVRHVHAIALDITDRAAVARLHEQLPVASSTEWSTTPGSSCRVLSRPCLSRTCRNSWRSTSPHRSLSCRPCYRS